MGTCCDGFCDGCATPCDGCGVCWDDDFVAANRCASSLNSCSNAKYEANISNAISIISSLHKFMVSLRTARCSVEKGIGNVDVKKEISFSSG